MPNYLLFLLLLMSPKSSDIRKTNHFKPKRAENNSGLQQSCCILSTNRVRVAIFNLRSHTEGARLLITLSPPPPTLPCHKHLHRCQRPTASAGGHNTLFLSLAGGNNFPPGAADRTLGRANPRAVPSTVDGMALRRYK